MYLNIVYRFSFEGLKFVHTRFRGRDGDGARERERVENVKKLRKIDTREASTNAILPFAHIERIFRHRKVLRV